LLEGYKETVELSSQTILDPTVLEIIHQMSQGNALLRKENASKSIDSARNESASSVETEVLKHIPKKTSLTHNEPTKSLKMEQQSFDFDAKEEIELSPETMKEMMDRLSKSIRQVAEEIGIAHTTLSRYLRKENKRQNNKNDEKMLNWLKEKTLTNV
jgi:DNA-binding transcriptional ArsR family regulator